ncbi:MAG: SMP-30/gluconolactonase/LRE family protein [Alcanivoracaceae bacterium]|nr:SMP-30/gluconolactonase/LRE family protein [Alcanivoracaceae bacterium]
MKKIILVLVLAALGYLLFWPVPVEPVAWQAPQAPALDGAYAPNDRLAGVIRLAEGEGTGPEDVAIDALGMLYVGYDDGRVVRFDARGENPDLIADTGGRPLGLDFAPDGTLVVADAVKGLLRIGPGGQIDVLATGADGVPFRFTDDVDVADNGKIYFSDASSKFGPAMKARDDVIEHGGHGRLLEHDPASGNTRVLLDGLQFANGVAMCARQDCVLVTQTGSYNIVRYWLSGDTAGQHDIFLDNLPGIPDGISSNGTDTYWVALFAPRNALLDAMSDTPFLRKMAFRLPAFLQPQPAAHAFVLGLDQDGNVTHNLQHEGPDSFHPITSVEQHQGTLYFGSLMQPAFARMPLADAAGSAK